MESVLAGEHSRRACSAGNDAQRMGQAVDDRPQALASTVNDQRSAMRQQAETWIQIEVREKMKVDNIGTHCIILIYICKFTQKIHDQGTFGKVRIEEEANEVIEIRTEGRGRPVKKQKERQIHVLPAGALPQSIPMTKEDREQHDKLLEEQTIRELEGEDGVSLSSPEFVAGNDIIAQDRSPERRGDGGPKGKGKNKDEGERYKPERQTMKAGGRAVPKAAQVVAKVCMCMNASAAWPMKESMADSSLSRNSTLHAPRDHDGHEWQVVLSNSYEHCPRSTQSAVSVCQ